MNHFLAFILFPFLTFGNAFAHFHQGEFAPADHASRPHIHVGGHHHAADGHQHGDGIHVQTDAAHGETLLSQSVDSIDVPMDHDSTAVYLASDSDYACTAKPVDVQRELLQGVAVGATDRFAPALTIAVDPPVERRTGQLPLFLLHAALRL
ncbi:hypothetical protein [Stieleria mannarensis]|uniref:hypothetical protein n=1 Tax=Stieleria mannarensis TaxID=2755585 RepID=UPI0015FF7EED|nr:hypothetical protein [Rhodopirellula sp. JC639]